MSARTIESLHPATWASIQMQGGFLRSAYGADCGCSQQKDGKVWLCQYHAGYDDAAWAVEVKESPNE